MTRKLAGFAVVCAALGFAAPYATAQNNDKPLEIGVVKTFFNDVPQVIVDVGGKVFGDAMQGVAGLQGKLTTTHDAFQVADKLNTGELQLAVFHGHEYAWIQKKYPKLKPMVIAVNQFNEVKSYVIVHQSSGAKTIADLRGKKLDLPMGTKQQCVIHLERHCTNNNQPELKDFFGAVARSSTTIHALNDLADKKADAVLIDTLNLEFYKTISGPTFRKHLRVLEQSESFPPPVIVYKEGVMNAATFAQVRDGLLKAKGNPNPAARQILGMWHIESFQPIPDSYSKSLADTLKWYPVREATKIGRN